MPSISVVIPAKNEEETIGLVLRDLFATIARCPGHQFEVIVVDDHSTDRTAELVRATDARLLTNPGKSGKGAALRVGFAEATGELLVMLDADYSHRAEDIPRLLAPLLDDAEIGLVIGCRVWGGSEEYTHIRAVGNVFLSTALGLATRRYLSDALNGFKAFRRDVFFGFEYTSRAFEIEIELIAHALRRGYRIVEVSSGERARAGGQLKSRVVRHGTLFLLRIIWEGLRGVRPIPATDDEPAETPETPEAEAVVGAEGEHPEQP